MIPLILMFNHEGKRHRVKVRHYAVPNVGERLLPPDIDHEFTVLTVQHDLRVGNDIIVVLS